MSQILQKNKLHASFILVYPILFVFCLLEILGGHVISARLEAIFQSEVHPGLALDGHEDTHPPDDIGDKVIVGYFDLDLLAVVLGDLAVYHNVHVESLGFAKSICFLCT